MKSGYEFTRSRQAEARARRRRVFGSVENVLLALAFMTIIAWIWLLKTTRSPVYSSDIKYKPPEVAKEREVELKDVARTIGFRKDFRGTPRLVFYENRNCEGRPIDVVMLDLAHGICNEEFADGRMKLSARLEAPESLLLDVYTRCHEHGRDYHFSIYPLDGCVNVYRHPRWRYLRLNKSNLETPQITKQELNIQREMQIQSAMLEPDEVAKVRIVFSAESKEYFGYQVWANYYGFLTSGQTSATWTRLLTAHKRDDLPGVVKGMATFQAKRHPYSKRYSPINKPDVITKWFASADRPQEEIILVIDPDNWLLKDVHAWVSQVSKGYALGEAAYYHGSSTAQRLWRELCLRNCDVDIDTVGVPYVVHRDDLAVIAPLWKMYTLMIKERLENDHPTHEEFAEKYKRLDVSWASEMYGYNFASTHAGVKHKVIRRMQVRDVDSERSKERLKDVAMIHVGRAWFPPSYEPAKKWAHTEGKPFRRYGTQVWCKCNFTASTIMPWPVPEDADFQSTKTLELLHDSIEKFGPIPVNKEFRAGPGPNTYGHAVP